MQTTSNSYEYSYTNSNSFHHHRYLFPSLLELISQHKTNCTKKLRVLDLGCGNGSLSQKIAQQGYEVVGVEDSASGFLFACQNFPECTFVQASIYDLPYTQLESAFDIIISVEVIEHLLYPRELIKAAKKCLKPDGRLIITTPYHGYWKNLALALLGDMDKHFNPLWDGGHVKFFSVTTLSHLLKQEGFTDIHFKFAGRVPYFWKSMLCSVALAKN
jgi:2-polyprenyl-3-methyl-5-hydroxy-6-metoxy-1,4-benzoquinol methylase